MSIGDIGIVAYKIFVINSLHACNFVYVQSSADPNKLIFPKHISFINP